MCDVVLYFIKYVCRVFLDIGGSARATLSLLVQKSLCARERCVLRKIVHTRAHNIGRALNHMWL